MPKPMRPVPADQRFGRLVVVRELPTLPPSPSGSGRPRLIECRCDCGGTKVAKLRNLVRGYTLSCGCLARENVGRLARTHGLGTHPLYHTWWGMVQRCENPQAPGYRNYGGRGITVCPAWHDVAMFVAWIEANLGPRPAGMSLDRIDNDGNYQPGNVRWASAADQQRNRRRHRLRPLSPPATP